MGTYQVYIPTDVEEKMMPLFWERKKKRKDLTVSVFITERLRETLQVEKKST